MAQRSRETSLSVVAVVALVGSMLFGTLAARADTAPPDATTPKTVAADSLPTVQINGVVWAQVIVGNTVYVGGEFTKARPAGSAAGVNEVTRNNMLAYNLTTGVMTSFNPNVNAAVKALVASPDGSRVYAGGNFTSVSGANRYRLAAFTAGTGALVSTWAPVMNGSVKALGVTASTVYAGGAFSSASGATRNRVAAFAASNGALQAWTGTAAGGSVNALAVSPDGSKVVIGGSFTSYNGGTNPGYGLAATNSKTGASLPWKVNSLIRNAGANGAILSLAASADGVFGTGYDFGAGAMFEGTFRASWADGSIVWIEDCHGDTYSVAPVKDVVYTTGHAHYCGNIGGYGETLPRSYHRTLSFTTKATGTIAKNTVGNYYNFAGQPRPTLLAFYPDINTGTYTGQGQGPWNVTANGNYLLYGGEFTTVNFKKQQGLARFAVSAIAPDKEGPRVSAASFVPTLSSPKAGSVTVSWTSNYDRDNEKLTYQILRNGAVVQTLTGLSVDWKRPTMSWTNSGLAAGTYSYQLKAIDPFGNVSSGTAASITLAGAAAKAMAAPTAQFAVASDGLSASFDAAVSQSAGGLPLAGYDWNFGDRGSGSGVSAKHLYAAAGTYPVALTVTDAAGVTSTTTQFVTVSAPAAGAVPVDPATFAQDSFGRSMASSWGPAELGGAWSVPAGSASVADGVGVLRVGSVGATVTAQLPGASSDDTDARVSFALQQAASGSGVYVSLLGRVVGSDDYRARVKVLASGAVQLQLVHGGSTLQAVNVDGVTYVAGDQLRLRLQVTGTSPTTVRAKVWAASGTEPTAWQASVTDATAALQTAGGLGLSVYAGSSGTVPIAVSFDDLTARLSR